VFGRIQVFKGDSEVTSSCRASFDTSAPADETGWLFTSMPLGRVFGISVGCAVWNGPLTYQAGVLSFDVMGANGATYFGLVQIHLPDNDAAITASIAGDVLGVPLGDKPGNAFFEGYDEGPLKYVKVSDDRKSAIAEYYARYRRKLLMFTSIVGKSPGPVHE
jgi:hypothetical protein